jgi:DNA anti-recombination protein RmuC
MTNDEVERAIEFLLSSQAKHDTQIGELRETVAGLAQQVSETNRVLQMHAESQLQFNETLTTAITALADSQSRTDERLTRLAGLVEKLAERVGGA